MACHDGRHALTASQYHSILDDLVEAMHDSVDDDYYWNDDRFREQADRVLRRHGIRAVEETIEENEEKRLTMPSFDRLGQ